MSAAFHVWSSGRGKVSRWDESCGIPRRGWQGLFVFKVEWSISRWLTGFQSGCRSLSRFCFLCFLIPSLIFTSFPFTLLHLSTFLDVPLLSSSLLSLLLLCWSYLFLLNNLYWPSFCVGWWLFGVSVIGSIWSVCLFLFLFFLSVFIVPFVDFWSFSHYVSTLVPLHEWDLKI